MTCNSSLLECVSAPVFALTSDISGAFLAWNKALSQVTGISSVDAIGRTPTEVLGPGAASLSLAPPGVVQVSGLGLVVLERHDGMLIGTLQDREREAYLGMAAHDLRAPLRNVLYLAEEVLADTVSARQRDLIAKIANVSRNGIALTNDVVGCAQSLGYGEQPRSKLALHKLAQSVFSTLDPHGSHELECEIATLSVEQPVLLTILRNLLDNALRHGGVSKKSIKIEARPCDSGIQVSVADNGKGFKESALTFLSGGEFRVESGYGLVGLRRLIHARGGRIGVVPASKGKGSAVVVTLPGIIEKSDQVAIAS